MNRELEPQPIEIARPVENIKGLNLYARYWDLIEKFGKPGPASGEARQIREDVATPQGDVKVAILADLSGDQEIEVNILNENDLLTRTLFLTPGTMKFFCNAPDEIDDIGVNSLFLNTLRDVSRMLAKQEA